MRLNTARFLYALAVALVATLAVLAIYKAVEVSSLVNRGHIRILKSGREIRVLSELVVTTPSPTLTVSYRTAFDVLRDKKAVEKEVQDIWSDFQVDANQKKVTRILLWPTHIDIGLTGLRESTIPFEYRKDTEGKWTASPCRREAL